ncbi:MAG: hypothetical protein J6N55_11650 [Anaerovibrio sp.]|uniref:hypothetical protein n=1 Tax=Anaerovibrio sp. TaxID=1872532 RepID=UPI001B0C4217|nr:hypothetical protein [Anaerovibrio sp.]MBO6246914.1 hypothetical protein [Anaerovibrio sp.]
MPPPYLYNGSGGLVCNGGEVRLGDDGEGIGLHQVPGLGGGSLAYSLSGQGIGGLSGQVIHHQGAPIPLHSEGIGIMEYLVAGTSGQASHQEDGGQE